jgi:carnitine 3-dehydrogenase
MHLKEVKALEPIHTTTQILGADDKRLHIFQTIYHSPSGDALATGEQMLLHVNAQTKRTAPAEAAVLARLHDLAAGHAKLERPTTAGRAVGQKR